MENSKISIVTPSFNQGRYIEETILSVLSQNHSNIEHIIIDGGSSDNTLTILAKYDHIKWISEPDRGQSDALNKGFRMATGSWILWLNSDDILMPGSLQSYINVFSKNENANIIHGHVIFFKDLTNDIFRRQYFLNFNKFRTFFRVITHPSSGTLFKADLLKDNPLNVKFHYMMDSEWYMRCADFLSLVVINKFTVRFRISDNNKTSDQIQTGKFNPQQENENKWLYNMYALPVLRKYPNSLKGQIFILKNRYLKCLYRLSKLHFYIYDYVKY